MNNMSWLVGNFLLSTALTVGIVWSGYHISQRFPKVKAAQRPQWLYWMILIIIGLVIFKWRLDSYGISTFWLLAIAVLFIQVCSWPLRKFKAGACLYKDKHPPIKYSFFGLFYLTWLSVSLLWPYIWVISKTLPKGYIDMRPLSFLPLMFTFLMLVSWMSAIGRFTLWEKGICFQYSLIPWNRVRDYSISPRTPTTSQIPTIPTLPKILKLHLVPSPFSMHLGELRIPIYSKQIEDIERILKEKIEDSSSTTSTEDDMISVSNSPTSRK